MAEIYYYAIDILSCDGLMFELSVPTAVELQGRKVICTYNVDAKHKIQCSLSTPSDTA